MNDYDIRRRQAAEESGITPWIKWTAQVDGKLTHNKQQKGTCESAGHGKALGSEMIGKQAEVAVGALCFADDTATIAELEEEQAERIMTETTQDWEESLHAGKTEKIWLRPEGRHDVRGVGGRRGRVWLSHLP